MDKNETLEDFYRRKFDLFPDNFHKDVGHFNIFRLQPYVDGKPTKIPYRRRDFYKIMLVKGGSRVHYADQVVEVQKQALSFSNPLIPYQWEHLDKIREGIYCIFDTHFFYQFGQFQQYEVFQPNGSHVFELTDEQVLQVNQIYERMVTEFESDYKYRFDLIRNLIFELLHFALKLEPSMVIGTQAQDASQRISTLFLELLERQFPIDDSHTEIQLRAPSDFADQLNVHVNHLNRTIKKTLGKTTTQLIADRLLQEARILLSHSSWSVSEIAFALGFTEATHFSNFFKKHSGISPSAFRNV